MTGGRGADGAILAWLVSPIVHIRAAVVWSDVCHDAPDENGVFKPRDNSSCAHVKPGDAVIVYIVWLATLRHFRTHCARVLVHVSGQEFQMKVSCNTLTIPSTRCENKTVHCVPNLDFTLRVFCFML